jgi:hypothetical protein
MLNEYLRLTHKNEENKWLRKKHHEMSSFGIYGEDKHIKEVIFVSMRCEIIPGTYIYTYLSTNMMQVH